MTKPNPTAELLERRMEDRRAVERLDSIDRRQRIPHFLRKDIETAVEAMRLAA